MFACFVFQMRHSKRMRSPGVWLDEYCWEERMAFHKRRRRESHSSERENGSRRGQHLHRAYEGYKSVCLIDFEINLWKPSTFISVNFNIIAIVNCGSTRHRCLHSSPTFLYIELYKCFDLIFFNRHRLVFIWLQTLFRSSQLKLKDNVLGRTQCGHCLWRGQSW